MVCWACSSSDDFGAFAGLDHSIGRLERRVAPIFSTRWINVGLACEAEHVFGKNSLAAMGILKLQLINRNS